MIQPFLNKCQPCITWKNWGTPTSIVKHPRSPLVEEADEPASGEAPPALLTRKEMEEQLPSKLQLLSTIMTCAHQERENSQFPIDYDWGSEASDKDLSFARSMWRVQPISLFKCWTCAVHGHVSKWGAPHFETCPHVFISLIVSEQKRPPLPINISSS